MADVQDCAIPGDNRYQDYDYILDGKRMIGRDATVYLIGCGFTQYEAVKYKVTLCKEAMAK